MLIRRMYVKNIDQNLSKIVTAISYIININRSNFIVGIRLHLLDYIKRRYVKVVFDRQYISLIDAMES